MCVLLNRSFYVVRFTHRRRRLNACYVVVHHRRSELKELSKPKTFTLTKDPGQKCKRPAAEERSPSGSAFHYPTKRDSVSEARPQNKTHFLAELESQQLRVHSEWDSLRLQPFKKLSFYQHLLSLLEALLGL